MLESYLQRFSDLIFSILSAPSESVKVKISYTIHLQELKGELEKSTDCCNLTPKMCVTAAFNVWNA